MVCYGMFSKFLMEFQEFQHSGIFNIFSSAIDPEEIELVNENEIPLTIFGKLLPKMSETDFRLPWLTTKEELNKERNSFPKRNAPKRRKT